MSGSPTANAARAARPLHGTGLGYALAIRGMSFRITMLQTKTETLSDFIRVRGLWFYLVRYWLLLNRRRMGHVAAELLPERCCIVRINLRVIASTRDRDIGHAAVEQILSAQLGVHVNQDTVGSLSLAGITGHCITMVEMQMLARIEFDRAATVNFQT